LAFGIFLIQQLNLDWQINSKTKVEKAFFHVFLCGNEFLEPKELEKVKLVKIGYENSVSVRYFENVKFP
jgi:hypothetical protein